MFYGDGSGGGGGAGAGDGAAAGAAYRLLCLGSDITVVEKHCYLASLSRSRRLTT